jgi:GTP-binding protein HflX
LALLNYRLTFVGFSSHLSDAGESVLAIQAKRIRKWIAGRSLPARVLKVNRTDPPASPAASEGWKAPASGFPGQLHQCRQVDIVSASRKTRSLESPVFLTLGTYSQDQTRQRMQVLISDTVGFIRKLPHQLVSAFVRIKEVVEADLILHVMTCRIRIA